ncbi:MAG TPA: cellulase family glycosylhydrolase [Dysgonamonadaceae bacterium]|nr:cellulase family glycosylhydrolase [Dysgonamonadaceae bacterium]
MTKKTNFTTCLLTITIFGVIFMGCKADEIIETKMPKSITVRENRFVDNYGRHVILNGINVISKSKDQGYLIQKDSTLYSNLRDWGFNSVRFGIIWDGVEPQPGVYNEKYLQGIDQHIQWAANNDIFVVLDMHQDLYSVLYSNGAPKWATLHEDKPHRVGDIWSDAYMQSQAVQTSFDNFWANKLAPDGVGLQDHYAQMWQHIAKRYANNPAVIGYDLMNEPFAGSSAPQSIPTILDAYSKIMYESTGRELSQRELELIWNNVEDRSKALKNLSSEKSFSSVADALFPLNRDFEAHKLQPFYQKVSDAIREVDNSSVLFLEHAYLGNMGVRSSIARTTLFDGSPDSLLAYAPHGYDLVTDTESAAEASLERVSFIFNRFQEIADRLNMPVWLGEWGAFYRHGEEIVPVAQHAITEIENNLYGNAYWSYESKMENLAYFKQALLRPYPAFTNGELLEYNYDRASNTLSMTWQEDKDNLAPTQLFVPALAKKNLMNKIDKSFNATIKRIPNSSAGWLVIPPLEDGQKRKLVVRMTK